MRYGIMTLIAAVSLAQPVVGLASEKSVCTKDGRELTVSGKSEADQKRDCDKQNGTWSQKKAEPAQQEQPTQSSGSGGGW
jgi:hypothetical protein